MAQVSVQIAQDHIATAFHFLISKRLVGGFEDFAAPTSFDWPSSTSIASASSISIRSVQRRPAPYTSDRGLNVHLCLRERPQHMHILDVRLGTTGSYSRDDRVASCERAFFTLRD